MSYYIIGSYILERQSKDMDFLITLDQETPIRHSSNRLKKEYHISDTIYSIVDKYVSDETKETRVLNQSELLTLKLSHLNYDIHWGKHWLDCLELFEQGYKPIEPMYKELREAWKSIHGDKKHISLDKSADKFFTVNKDHDKLHLHFAYGWQPRFKQFLKEGSEVMVDKKKFFDMPLQHQYEAVMEEAMVIAYERNISLAVGLKHLITKLTKGWFNDFICLNLPNIKLHLEEAKIIFKNKKELLCYSV